MTQNRNVNVSTSVRKITVAGLLGGIAILLGATSLGYIPTPWGLTLTLMHIPVILGAVLEGPYVGVATGLIFGLSSFLMPRSPAMADPLVSVLPRLVIGIFAYLAFRATGKEWVGAIVGTATNTIGVLGMILIRGYLPLEVVLTTALTNGILEIILATILVLILVPPLKRLRNR
ncbi:MAG: ECF transporter S component [Firmicutes bacterium]|nr:ECF transporter S component [Bacillota bacterium]MDD4263958.1 ECF transporter S component [Bacillota bacterium]MDD4693581.1 ECF transporter S component [Bacillota bacterium]